MSLEEVKTILRVGVAVGLEASRLASAEAAMEAVGASKVVVVVLVTEEDAEVGSLNL